MWRVVLPNLRQGAIRLRRPGSSTLAGPSPSSPSSSIPNLNPTPSSNISNPPTPHPNSTPSPSPLASVSASISVMFNLKDKQPENSQDSTDSTGKSQDSTDSTEKSQDSTDSSDLEAKLLRKYALIIPICILGGLGAYFAYTWLWRRRQFVVEICNVSVVNNPSPIDEAVRFIITCKAKHALEHALKVSLVYFTSDHGDFATTVHVGPFDVGLHCFTIEGAPQEGGTLESVELRFSYPGGQRLQYRYGILITDVGIEMANQVQVTKQKFIIDEPVLS